MTPVRKPMIVPPINPSKVICTVILAPSSRLGMAAQMTDHSNVTLIAFKNGSDHQAMTRADKKENGDPVPVHLIAVWTGLRPIRPWHQTIWNTARRRYR